MRTRLLALSLVLAVLLGSGHAQAAPMRAGATALATLRNTAVHPFRTLAGALRPTKLHLLEGEHVTTLPAAQQRQPGQIAYRTVGGMGIFKTVEELLARANLTGKTSVSDVNGAHMVVHPGARLDDVHTQLYISLGDAEKR